MQLTMLRPAHWLPTLALVLAGALPLSAQIIRDPPPVIQPPLAGRPGPAWVKAVAVVPLRLDLQWAPVLGAGWYQLFRSSSLDGGEKLLDQIPENTADQDVTKGYYFHFDYLPERSGSVTFSYRVVALFVGTDGSKTPSLSTTASVQAMQPAAPPKFKYRVAMSQLMGRLRVTFDWGSVPLATGYHIFQIPRPGLPPLPLAEQIIKQTSFTIDNVVPGQGGTVCVTSVYEAFLKDDTVRSCELVILSK